MLWNIITFVLFIVGFPLLIYGADSLVKGASRLAVAWGVSALAVGLTVVAYGTSMPELAVTVLAVWNDTGDAVTASGAADIAVGNVVGSNIANILLVLGASAVVAPLIVSREALRRSLPLMIFISFLVLAFAWDFSGDGRSVITWWQGLILVAGVFAYTARAVMRGRAEKKLQREQAEEIEEEFGQLGEGRWAWAIEVGRIVIGLVCLIAGGKFLVNGAVQVAEWLDVSELVISLTIVAIGTSLPEVATCVMAVLRGHRDLAVGNAVGSNIFNILLVLGSCSVVAPGGGVPVNELAMARDIPFMLIVALLTLPVFYTGYIIARWEGWMFLGLYAAYTIYLILRANDPPDEGGSGGELFALVMIGIVAMIFLIVLTQSGMQLLQQRRAESAGK